MTTTRPVSNTPPERIKRLCILSDGSWASPHEKTRTNIVRLASAIKYEGKGQIQQVVRYDPGVGTAGSQFDRLKGGVAGDGIDANIMELYMFLALNYHPGDEIYLFGFSRGAYTVRSLAGMIHEAGLVHRDHMMFVDDAYDLYRDNVGADSDTAVAFRKEHGDRVPIKMLACFDTVGSLGLPWESPPFVPDWHRAYRFHDVKLGTAIENAVHAVSIDEDRRAFRPTLMEVADGDNQDKLLQRYFPGGHGIGGGSADEEEERLAYNALRFVVDAIKSRTNLELDESLIPDGGHVDVEPVERSLAYNAIRFLTGVHVRDISSVDLLHETAVKRYARVEKWRPAALAKLHDRLKN